MRTQANIASRINAERKSQERSWAWIARQTGIEYKRLLRQAKNCDVALTLENAALIAAALDVDLADLVAPHPFDPKAVAR